MHKIDHKPKVTIVSAVWNLYDEGRVEFFEQMMETVHNQTYSNIEHLIVNNNSTDGTAELIDKYVQKGWAKVVFEPEQGLWHAMNRGIQEAAGEFINFMNSDDFFSTEQAVELVMTKIQQEGADWGYGASYMVNRDNINEIYWKWIVPDWQAIYSGKCPNHQAIFLRTSLLKKMGGFKFNPKHPYSMCDDFVTMELVFGGYVPAVIGKYIVKFRNGGASKNTNSLNTSLYVDYIMEKVGRAWGIDIKFFEMIYYEWAGNNLFSVNFRLLASEIEKIQIPQWKSYMNEKYEEWHKAVKKPIKKSKYYLFGLIPVLKVYEYQAATKCNLFGFLPALTTCWNEHQTKIKYYLFGIIPVWKIKRK